MNLIEPQAGSDFPFIHAKTGPCSDGNYKYLVMLAKGFCTEIRLGLPVYEDTVIEETGAAQYYRNVKILTIHKKTTVILAHDLIARKMVRSDGMMALGPLTSGRAE